MNIASLLNGVPSNKLHFCNYKWNIIYTNLESSFSKAYQLFVSNLWKYIIPIFHSIISLRINALNLLTSIYKLLMNCELLCCGKITKLGRPKIALSVFGSKSFSKICSPLKSNMANRTAHSKNYIQHDK